MSRLHAHTRSLSAMRYLKLLGTVAVLALGRVAAIRPSCIFGDKPIDAYRNMRFCPKQDEGTCCTQLEELLIQAMYSTVSPESGLTGKCADIYKEVACGPCNSHANTIYKRLVGELGPVDGMTMTRDFCAGLVKECEGQIEFRDYDGLSYCEKHAGRGSTDLNDSFPLTSTELGTSSIGFVDAFPDLGDWEYPERLSAVHMTPDGDEWWLAGQDGEIKKILVDFANIILPVVDTSLALNLFTSQVEGLLDFAFSPAYATNHYFYVSSTIKGDEGPVNSLSRFTYFEDSVVETLMSVETLLTTLARDLATASARYVGFSPASFADPGAETHQIYWSVGSGIQDSTVVDEKLRCLESSIVRLDVPSGTGVDDVGYSIPIGNHEGGCSTVCASGLHASNCAFDSLNGDLHCCDMGDTMVEEIDLITCGEDYGWGTFEGTHCYEGESYGDHDVCSDANPAGSTLPIFEYCHQGFMVEGGEDVCGNGAVIGDDIVGGHVYRGSKYPMLAGAMIFADTTEKNIYCLVKEEDAWVPRTIIGNNTVSVRSFAEDATGELYMITTDNRITEFSCGEYCETTCLEQADPPSTFKSLGCFAHDTENPGLGLLMAPECWSGQNFMTPEVCGAYCETVEGSIYFGVGDIDKCFCGGEEAKYYQHGPMDIEACSLPCPGATDGKCGGLEAIEVFIYSAALIPGRITYSFFGCYTADIGAADLLYDALNEAYLLSGASVNSKEMSLETCSELCRGSQYFGLMHGTQCVCSALGDDFTVSKEGLCDIPCPGGGTTMVCGGKSAMSIFVYGTIAPSPAPSPEISDDESYMFEGCFEDKKGARVLRNQAFSGDEMTPEACKSFCKDYKYFGTEFGKECFCGSPDIFDAKEAANCDMACSGDYNHICGGRDAISVFRKIDAIVEKPPGTWVGCFTDSKSQRVMPVVHSSKQMTNVMCATLCEEYTHYGTEYGKECWCSNETTFRQRGKSNECTTPCYGDKHQTCGGFNALSVYKR